MLNFKNLSPVICLTHDDTVKAGEQLAGYLSARLDDGQGIIIALQGQLGVGKTTFVKGFAKGLGISASITSPTYQLVTEYQSDNTDHRKLILYHIDLYRVESASQLASLALDDLIYGPEISVIEWAERADHLLPKHTVHVQINIKSDFSRIINITEPEQARS